MNPKCPFALEASGDTEAVLDGPKLQQLFSNLLNNAAPYRDGANPVTIIVRREKETISVRVSNQGPIIPAASQDAIFDPMIQLAVKEGQQKGAANSSLGLGLFIAREVTEAHGGTIKAESTEERGTVFTVSLPRQAAHDHGGAGAPARYPQ
ncbi:Two component system histidine kinase [Polaromonas sp. CG9_12]|nr:Two component system histidine kinase [Polaromonas sp. CG9_12]